MRVLRRIWMVIALLGLCQAVLAQEGLPPMPTPVEPSQPSLPVEPVPAGRIRILSDRQIFSPALGLYQFFGNVSLEANGVVIRADEASYSTETNVALARGNVSIRAEDGVTYWGNLLEYTVATRTWRFVDYFVDYPPEFLGPPFIAPVFLAGRDISGTAGFLRAGNTSVTTCNKTVPHYYLRARRVEIFAGQKLLAWDTDLYVLGRRVLHLPYFFLSLQQRRSPIVPDFGRNDYEGYYLRLLYQYILDPENVGGVRLDSTEKLGEGQGIDHFYTLSRGAGELFLYGRQNLDEYVVRLKHQQQLTDTLLADVTADLRNDSQFSPQPTTSTNINTLFTNRTPHTSSTFNLTRRFTEGTFATDNTSANLRFQSTLGRSLLRYSGEYSSFGRERPTGSTPDDQELWNRLQWSRQFDIGSLNLRVDDRNDLDGDRFLGDTFFSGIERLPEVYLESDQNRLNWDFVRHIPSRFTVGWGKFVERPANTDLDRYLFNWQASPRPISLGASVLNPTLGFRQTVYGDRETTAQYNYNAGLTARTTFGAWTNVATYGRQNVHGFTPFRFDYVYPYESATESLQYITPTLRAYLTTGRDLENDRWQDLTFRSEAQVSRRLFTRQSFGYDLNNSTWRDLVSEFQWRDDPTLTVDMSARYSLAGAGLRRVSSQVKWVLSPVWRLQWLGGYDFNRDETLYNEFLITRDLHCWDVSFLISQQQEAFYVYFRLKALNVTLPQFGIGRGGQILTPTEGTVF